MNGVGKVHGSLDSDTARKSTGGKIPGYSVQIGDTPASIAARITGDPYRMNELVAANGDKQRQYVDGCVTFKTLGVGEVLRVPGNWSQPRGLGALTQTDLLPLVQAIIADNTLCQATHKNPNPRVLAFQTAFNQSVLVNANGGPPTSTTIDVDGLYGKDSAAAAAMVSSGVPAPCAHFGVVPGGSYSPLLIAAGKALDVFLATSACSACKTGDTSSPMAKLTFAFKSLALVTPGQTGTAVPTVDGGSVNMVGAAAYAYGPGTNDLLTHVLGASRSYKGGACTDSAGNCLGVSPPVLPGGGGGTPGGTPGGTTQKASSSSYVPWIVGGALVAAGGYALYWMSKHPGHVRRLQPSYSARRLTA